MPDYKLLRILTEHIKRAKRLLGPEFTTSQARLNYILRQGLDQMEKDSAKSEPAGQQGNHP